MDGQRFDRLTCRVSEALTRRRFGGLLAILGLGARLGSAAPATAKKKGKKKKKKKKGCPNDTVKCGNVCVNTQTDDDHCGNCVTACGQGETCQSGQCEPTQATCGSGGNCRVFATSTIYAGNLGGLTGADQKSNDRAQAAGLPGAYKAWLADSAGTPSSRFVQSTGQYVLVTGAKIADDWAGLTNDDPNHELDHEINRDEFGVEITEAAMFRATWTNVNPDGTLQDEDRHCQSWSTSEGTPNFGNAGNVNSTDSFWTFATSIFCNNNGLRLYCFQQS